MKKSTKKDIQLAELASMLSALPNIWSASSVKAEPQKWLIKWQIYRVITAKIQPEAFGYHLVGFDVQGGHGAVSSKVGQFDPVKMCGVTNSGRIYQLVGMPGSDPDAQYTLNGWAVANQVTMKDATDEFIRDFKINLDQVQALSPQS